MIKKYPGWEYQYLFDYMSENYVVSLTRDEMDEIIILCAEVTDLKTQDLVEEGLGGIVDEGEIQPIQKKSLYL